MRQLKTRIKVVSVRTNGVDETKYYPQYKWLNLVWVCYNKRKINWAEDVGYAKVAFSTEAGAKSFLSVKIDEWINNCKNGKSVWYIDYPDE